MAGRPKAAWTAGIRSIGRTFREGSGILVHMRIRLDREPSREIDITLSMGEAKKWRDALTTMIEKTEKGE